MLGDYALVGSPVRLATAVPNWSKLQNIPQNQHLNLSTPVQKFTAKGPKFTVNNTVDFDETVEVQKSEFFGDCDHELTEQDKEKHFQERVKRNGQRIQGYLKAGKAKQAELVRRWKMNRKSSKFRDFDENSLVSNYGEGAPFNSDFNTDRSDNFVLSFRMTNNSDFLQNHSGTSRNTSKNPSRNTSRYNSGNSENTSKNISKSYFADDSETKITKKFKKHSISTKDILVYRNSVVHNDNYAKSEWMPFVKTVNPDNKSGPELKVDWATYFRSKWVVPDDKKLPPQMRNRNMENFLKKPLQRARITYV